MATRATEPSSWRRYHADSLHLALLSGSLFPLEKLFFSTDK